MGNTNFSCSLSFDAAEGRELLLNICKRCEVNSVILSNDPASSKLQTRMKSHQNIYQTDSQHSGASDVDGESDSPERQQKELEAVRAKFNNCPNCLSNDDNAPSISRGASVHRAESL